MTCVLFITYLQKTQLYENDLMNNIENRTMNSCLIKEVFAHFLKKIKKPEQIVQAFSIRN